MAVPLPRRHGHGVWVYVGMECVWDPQMIWELSYNVACSFQSVGKLRDAERGFFCAIFNTTTSFR